MHQYEFHVPTRVLVGLESLERLGEVLARSTRRRRVLMIRDPGPWVGPAVERLETSLAGEGFEVARTFDEIGQNPLRSACEKGVQAVEKGSVDVCVALGGGSVIDASKWIAWKTRVKLFVAVPTTAGTGTEVNEWAVVTEDETHLKQSVRCRAPDLAVLDATVTTSMPPPVTLFSGLDAFSHGLESCLSYLSSPMTDLLSLEACRVAVENLERCLEDGSDMEARSNMLHASLYAGMAMRNAGLGVLHCVANIVPGYYPQYPHGLVCGSLLEKTMEHNQEAVPMRKQARLYGYVREAGRLLDTYLGRFQLSGVTLERERVPEIAAAAASNVNRFTNPRRVTRKLVERLITESFTIQ